MLIKKSAFMKPFKLFTFLFLIISLISCETLKNASNSTGNVFSLNGQWELESSTPENTLIGSRVTVTPFISEGKITLLKNNTQCYRENDLKWKNISSDKNGGFTINNLLSNCAGGNLNYQPAAMFVMNSNQIRVTGRNLNNQDNVQVWKRVTQ